MNKISNKKTIEIMLSENGNLHFYIQKDFYSVNLMIDLNKQLNFRVLFHGLASKFLTMDIASNYQSNRI